MEENKIVVIIDGVGVSEAKNDRAQFILNLKSRAETLDLARGQLEEKVKQVIKELGSEEIDFDGNIETSFVNFKLEHREGQEKYSAGFQSTCTITFTTIVSDNIDNLYKKCLKIDDSMLQPMFFLKDREVLVKDAMEKVGINIKEKLQKECDLLDVNVAGLKILNWNFGYDGTLPDATSQNKLNHIYNNSVAGGVYGATGAIGPMGLNSNYRHTTLSVPATVKVGSIYQERLDLPKLEPGLTSVNIVARVNYIWK